MGLCSTKQTRNEATHPSFADRLETIHSRLITEQLPSRLVRSQALRPISNFNDFGPRISDRYLRPVHAYAQFNFNNDGEASCRAPQRLSTPRVLFKNPELVQVLLQQFEVPYRFPYNGPLSLEPILPGSDWYDFVMTKFCNNKFNWNYAIVEIKRVWNPYLMAQYMLTKKKGGNNFAEKYLFHGTSQEALSGVLNDNFNWRKVILGKWGWGVSFANNPWYASHYSKKKQQCQEYLYVMVLVKVLVEYGPIGQGDRWTKVPTTGYSTTNPTREVIVKYDDASFYPEFIVYFRERMCC